MRKRLSVLVLGLAICVALSSSGQSADKPESRQPLKTITIGTFSKAYGNLPYYVAKHLRWFEKDPGLLGIIVRYTEYNDRPAISDAFSTRNLQVLFSGDAPALLCRAQGNDIRAVAVSGNAKQEILVAPDSIVKSVAELRGKRLAVQQATSSHYALLKTLRLANMKESDLVLMFMAPGEARVAFESSRIDAWAVWAPFVEQEQAAGKGRVLVGSEALINSVMSVPTEMIQQNESVVRAVVNAVQKAKDWMTAHPEDAKHIAAQELGLDPKVVEIAWPKFNWKAQLDDTVARDLQEKIDFLAALDKTRQSKSFDVAHEYVETRFQAPR